MSVRNTSLTRVFFALGIVLLLVASGAWWYKSNLDTRQAFWSMLSQSLATGSVTVHATSTSNGADVDELVQYTTGAYANSHGLTTLSQGTTNVTDETFGTTTADYTRYDKVATDQKSASGKPLNFSSILGVWAQSAATTGSRPVQFSQALLGTGLPLGGVAIPIANLNADQRATLLATIRNQNVFEPNFDTVKKTRQNGRLLYTYNVTIQPILYASMMKNFAQSVGIHDLDSLDPNTFSGQQRLQLQLTVDVFARHLVTAAIPTAHITQTYTGYDAPVQVQAPAHTISATELQTRLTNLQK